MSKRIVSESSEPLICSKRGQYLFESKGDKAFYVSKRFETINVGL